MVLDINIDLSSYYPNDIIDLHRSGIVSLQEIQLSDCYYSEFGETLKEYVRKCLILQAESDFLLAGETKITASA